jgi:hypothetical protein
MTGLIDDIRTDVYGYSNSEKFEGIVNHWGDLVKTMRDYARTRGGTYEVPPGIDEIDPARFTINNDIKYFNDLKLFINLGFNAFGAMKREMITEREQGGTLFINQKIVISNLIAKFEEFIANHPQV